MKLKWLQCFSVLHVDRETVSVESPIVCYVNVVVVCVIACQSRNKVMNDFEKGKLDFLDF